MVAESGLTLAQRSQNGGATTRKHTKAVREWGCGEWFKRFEICCKANAWDQKAKVLKLPTLLEGEALATWMELSEDEQGDYGAAKQKMIERMVPVS